MNHKTQFEKIEKAYTQYKLSIGCPHCNFVGTLLNNNPDWVSVIKKYDLIEGQVVPIVSTILDNLNKGLSAIEQEGNMFYEMNDILELDRKWRTYWYYWKMRNMPTEEALHRTLYVTLNLLKEIHVRKEQKADYIYLNKREEKEDMKLISAFEEHRLQLA